MLNDECCLELFFFCKIIKFSRIFLKLLLGFSQWLFRHMSLTIISGSLNCWMKAWMGIHPNKISRLETNEILEFLEKGRKFVNFWVEYLPGVWGVSARNRPSLLASASYLAGILMEHSNWINITSHSIGATPPSAIFRKLPFLLKFGPDWLCCKSHPEVHFPRGTKTWSAQLPDWKVVVHSDTYISQNYIIGENKNIKLQVYLKVWLPLQNSVVLRLPPQYMMVYRWYKGGYQKNNILSTKKW